jgi:hypothetical protein
VVYRDDTDPRGGPRDDDFSPHALGDVAADVPISYAGWFDAALPAVRSASICPTEIPAAVSA